MEGLDDVRGQLDERARAPRGVRNGGSSGGASERCRNAVERQPAFAAELTECPRAIAAELDAQPLKHADRLGELRGKLANGRVRGYRHGATWMSGYASMKNPSLRRRNEG
jgi:hypothetical protein